MIAYEWTSQAERQLRKLPAQTQHQIVKKLEWFLSAPEPLQFAEPLVGREGKVYRFRMTAYRVIFELAHGKVLITAVGRRDRIY
jgi:mRNA-degrading endonuclease RelE of RelBE toxin-antitoxin system